MILLLSSFYLIMSSAEAQVATEFRQTEFLDTANYLRGSVFPYAANMLKLKWDNQLASSAATFAATCPTKHRRNPPGSEILYFGGTNNISVLMMFFYMERQLYDYYNPSACVWPICGHYTVLTTSNMENLGCAITSQPCSSSSQYHAICYLNPNGVRRIRNDVPYSAGEKCSSCPNKFGFCESGLCTSSTAGATCQKTCKNCAQLLNSCICNCLSGFLSAPDCSVRDAGVTSNCTACNIHPTTRPCKNGGRPNPSQCSICTCANGFTGNYCQYTSQQLSSGVLLYLQWSRVVYRADRIAYYPMNNQQGPAILNAIRPVIVTATQSQCSITIRNEDVSFAEGFPFIDGDGRMRVQLLIRSTMPCKGTVSQAPAYLPQNTVLTIANSAMSSLGSAVTACCGVTIHQIKIGTSADFLIAGGQVTTEKPSHTSTAKTTEGQSTKKVAYISTATTLGSSITTLDNNRATGGSNAGVIVGAIFGTILIGAVVAGAILVAIAHFYPKKLPWLSARLPWNKTNATAKVTDNRL